MKLNNIGFTLIEILVAILISSIIVIAGYGVFNSVVSLKYVNEKKSDFNLIKNKLTILLNSDINSSVNVNPEKNDFLNEKFSITTRNSLFFNRSIPVTVIYSLKDNCLFRSEINSQLGLKRTIKLIGGIKKFEVRYFNGNKYVENYNKPLIFKFILNFDKEEFEIIAGKLLL